MEIKSEIQENFLHVKGLMPKMNRFDDHFQMDIPELKNQLIEQAEKNWRELQDFEFKRMDIKKTFEQLLRF